MNALSSAVSKPRFRQLNYIGNLRYRSAIDRPTKTILDTGCGAVQRQDGSPPHGGFGHDPRDANSPDIAGAQVPAVLESHARARESAGWDTSISPFFSGRREPAQVSYIGICRGGPRDGKRMAEPANEKKIFFREWTPTLDDDSTMKHQGAYRYLDGAWLWELLA